MMPYWFAEKIRNRFLLHRYLQPFCRWHLAHRIYTPANTIALFTQPRSGSSWLAELLNHIPNSTILNEPLWRGHIQTHGIMPRQADGKVDEIKKLDFYFYQPIPEKAIWPEAEFFFDKLFRGGVCKLGLYDLNDFRNLEKSNVFVIKFCYANLLFHWLIARFPIQPVVLLRHPCAVVTSQLHHYSWQMLKKQPFFALASFPYNSYYHQYLELLKEIHSPEGILAALWSINIKAIHQPHDHNKQWLTIAYEKLYLNAEEEITRLFSWLGHPVPPAVWNNFMRPSISTSDSSFKLIQNRNPAKHLSRWMEDLNKDQIKNIMDVVAAFGINIYTADSLEPDYNKLTYQP